jgi:hypothetical protein
MKTGSRIVAAALGGALCLATSTGLSAADPRSFSTIKPLMAASIEAGHQRIVSYFLNAEGVCKLTLMIDETSRDKAGDPSPSVSRPRISRLLLTIEPGRNARFDAPDGKSMSFACLGRAQAMSVTTLDRVAMHGEEQ